MGFNSAFKGLILSSKLQILWLESGSVCISEMLRPCVLIQLLSNIRAFHIQTISFVYSLFHWGGVQHCFFRTAASNMLTVHPTIFAIKQSLYKLGQKLKALGG